MTDYSTEQRAEMDVAAAGNMGIPDTTAGLSAAPSTLVEGSAGTAVASTPLGEPVASARSLSSHALAAIDTVERWFAVSFPTSPFATQPGAWNHMVEMKNSLVDLLRHI